MENREIEALRGRFKSAFGRYTEQSQQVVDLLTLASETPDETVLRSLEEPMRRLNEARREYDDARETYVRTILSLILPPSSR